MSELDDLEEIEISPRRDGSAKRARAGRKNIVKFFARSSRRPKWKDQLKGERNWDIRRGK